MVTDTAAKVCPTVCPRPQDSGHELSESADDETTADRDFAAALLMIERLPLSNDQKAEAVRRLLTSQSK